MKTLSAALLASLLGLAGVSGFPSDTPEPAPSPGVVLLGVGCCKNAV